MQMYTTGQAAKLLQVAPKTICMWFDSGRLKGYVIPGSKDRRIPQEYLVKFLEDHGMPIPEELRPAPDAPPRLNHLRLKLHIRHLHVILQQSLSKSISDNDTITHLLQFRDNVMKAINDH